MIRPHATILLAVLVFVMSASAQAQNWRGGFGGMGEAMEQAGQMMLNSALQEERERRLMQQRYDQERQMMERQIEARRAAIEQQQQVREIISTQQRMIEERDQRISALLDQREKLVPLLEELRVYRKHPTWSQTVRSERFGAWLNKQPEDIRALSDSSRGEDAIRLLDAFQADTASKQKTQPPARPASLRV